MSVWCSFPSLLLTESLRCSPMKRPPGQHYLLPAEPQSSLGWRRDLQRSSDPSHCQRQGHLSRDPAAQSALNASSDGASTTALHNLFQCLTALITEHLVLMSGLNLPWFSSEPLPPVLALQAHGQKSLSVFLRMMVGLQGVRSLRAGGSPGSSHRPFPSRFAGRPA